MLPFPTWAAPISTWLGSWLPAWWWAISVVALIKVIISMVWAIVIARNLSMGVAWHRFLAFPNIYFKREDSGRTALGALRPMMSGGEVLDLEEADPEVDTFGVGKVEDFSWKGWLDFATCTECGRCQSQCPAWNTAKPLSPKLVMLALRDHSFAKAPYIRAGGGIDLATGEEKLSEAELAAFAHADPLAMLEAGRPLIGPSELDELGREVGGIIDPEVLWDCTTCGACVEQCPVDIEHVDHIVDMRRYQVMIESEFPSELGGLFRNLENKGNPWGQNQKDRLAWAKDLPFDVPVVTDTIDPDHEYLFWVGCAGAFEDRAKKTTAAVAELMHMAAVGFAVLGTGETCTGDPARRAGNEFLFQMLAQTTVENLNTAFGERTTRKIVVTCPHCFNTLGNEYGALGGDYEVIHHTQLLNRLVRDRRLIVKKPAGSRDVTYHDPCYLGRHNKVYSPPRELIEASGVTLKEMPRNSARSLCCGAGGARMWMEEKIGKRINLERTDEALATGAEQIATGCPFCKVMLTDGLTARQGEPTAEIARDIRRRRSPRRRPDAPRRRQRHPLIFARAWQGATVENDTNSALAEFSQAIAGDILTLPELSDPEWDTYAMVAEVTDFSVKMVAYRYTESGPPVPTEGPVNSWVFAQLRDRTRGTDGEAWDIAIVKIHRDTAQLVVNFVSGDGADLWRVSPANMGNFREMLRPRREDFLRG